MFFCCSSSRFIASQNIHGTFVALIAAVTAASNDLDGVIHAKRLYITCSFQPCGALRFSLDLLKLTKGSDYLLIFFLTLLKSVVILVGPIAHAPARRLRNMAIRYGDISLINSLFEDISQNAPAIEAHKLLIEQYISFGWNDAASDQTAELLQLASNDADAQRLHAAK